MFTSGKTKPNEKFKKRPIDSCILDTGTDGGSIGGSFDGLNLKKKRKPFYLYFLIQYIINGI